MQLMVDCVSVLGSRHGLLVDPLARECRILRFDRFTRMPAVQLRAGVIIDGKEYLLPLCPDGRNFDFVDQRTTPCTARFIGLHADSCLRLELTIASPFRPRDADFSARRGGSQSSAQS